MASRPGSSRLTGRGFVAVVVAACGLLLLHLPRAERLFLEGAPKMTEDEAAQFPMPGIGSGCGPWSTRKDTPRCSVVPSSAGARRAGRPRAGHRPR